ncbi:glycosyltransferase family 61 protein [Methylobacterium sp. EM32]|uniref:glycosyltransferase family 61 protein n=1 Tax=Methylobacterium sp. EM32 TaxID=3163481 RepID=UPI0033A8C40F
MSGAIARLTQEFASTANEGRRDRLRKFLNLCNEEKIWANPQCVRARLLYRDAFVQTGRCEQLYEAAEKPLSFEGAIVEDMDVSIIDLHGALVLSDQTVLLDEGYVTEHVRHMSGRWLETGEGYDFDFVEAFDTKLENVALKLPAGRVDLPQDQMYFLFHSIIGTASFGHFLHDTIIQAVVYDYLCSHFGRKLVPIFCSYERHVVRYPGMQWLLEKTIGSAGSVVQIRPNSSLYVPSCYTSNRLMHLGDGGISQRAVSYMREKIFANAKYTSRGSGRLVYISRKDVNSREAANINEVEDILRDEGFEFILIQGMDPQVVFDHFYNADIIVGMHGSGLTNCIYTKKPATLIELAYEGHLWDSILALAAACGHDAVRVHQKNGEIDIEHLRTAIHNARTQS